MTTQKDKEGKDTSVPEESDVAGRAVTSDPDTSVPQDEPDTSVPQDNQ